MELDALPAGIKFALSGMKRIGFAWVAGAVVLALLLAWWLFAGRRERFEGGALATADPQCVYDEAQAASSNRLVLYYADWCPHCTHFKPEFTEARTQASNLGLDVAFVSVNVDKQGKGSECLSVKGVTGFPTVQLERDGTSPPYVTYNGRRNAKDLVEWLKTSLAQ